MKGSELSRKSKLNTVFGKRLMKAVSYFSFVQVRSQGPAVTLIITNITNGREYSIDLTLAIKDKSWPEDAVEWIGRSRKGNKKH